MNKFVAIIFVIIFMLSTPILRADNEDYDVLLSESEESDGDDSIHNDYPKGHRSAPMLTPCTINYINGVTIYSDEGSIDIVSYEIWNVNGETCHGVYPAERQFINALFANKGEYIVVFTTTDKKYTGYIWLE